jgi:hypothetical protein
VDLLFQFGDECCQRADRVSQPAYQNVFPAGDYSFFLSRRRVRRFLYFPGHPGIFLCALPSGADLERALRPSDYVAADGFCGGCLAAVFFHSGALSGCRPGYAAGAASLAVHDPSGLFLEFGAGALSNSLFIGSDRRPGRRLPVGCSRG